MSPLRPIGRVKGLKIPSAWVRVPQWAPIWVRGVIGSTRETKDLVGKPVGVQVPPSPPLFHNGVVAQW